VGVVGVVPTEPGFTVPGPHVRLVLDVLEVDEFVPPPVVPGAAPEDFCTQFEPNGDVVVGVCTTTVAGTVPDRTRRIVGCTVVIRGTGTRTVTAVAGTAAVVDGVGCGVLVAGVGTTA
jgi:hypothetical protein